MKKVSVPIRSKKKSKESEKRAAGENFLPVYNVLFDRGWQKCILAGVIALYIIFTGVGHICPEFTGVRDSRLSQNGFSPGRKKTGENSPGTTGEGFFG